MGREIRRVPPDWSHPRYTAEDAPSPAWIGEYRPLHDEAYAPAGLAWLAQCDLWQDGQHPDQAQPWAQGRLFYWEHDAPPDPEFYRDRAWKDAEATAYQVYETVTEGTPISPVCPDEPALVAWLVEHEGLSPEGARRFIQLGSVPSAVMIVGASGVQMASNLEIPDVLEAQK